MEKKILLPLLSLLLLFVPAMAVAQQIDDLAPDRAQGLKAQFDGPSLSGKVTFTLPTSSYGGTALTDSVGYQLSVAYSPAASGKGMPGEQIECQVSVPYAYTTLFSVTTSNSHGNGPAANLYQWVGYAEPKAVTNLRGSFNEADRSIALTWDAVTEAQTEGYFDPADVSYIVVRMHDNGFGFDRDTVAQGVKATSFTDHLAYEGNTSFMYVVTSVNGDVLGYTAQTPNINVGGSLVPPFIEHFDSQADFGRWNTIDANDDWNTWEYDYYGQQAQYHYGEQQADDWLLSPDLKLTTGHDYKLSFKTRSAHSQLLERLAVALGKGDDASAYTTLLIPAQLIPASDTIISCSFSVPEAANYRVGFHALSDANHSYLYIDDVAVVPGAEYTAPGMATELSISNAEQGANISFKAPTTTVDGQPLAAITKIVLLRGDTLAVDSTLNAVPGATATLSDRLAPTGMTTYAVVAYNASGEGLHALASAYVGSDAPTAPASVRLKDNLDGTATLSWTAPKVGIHGGAIDRSKLRYTVYTIDQRQMIVDEKVAESIADTSYTITGIDREGRQQVLYYGVSAQTTSEDETDPVASTPIISGKPDTLPYLESFANGHIEHDLLWTEQKGIYPFSVTTSYAADADNGAAYWYTDSIGEEGWINTGKIDFSNSSSPMMAFSMRVNPGALMTLKVEVATAEGLTDTVKVVNCADSQANSFTDYTVDLSKYKGQQYIIVKFNAIGGEHYSPVLVDNIRIVDARDGDMAVVIQSHPDSLKVSHEGSFGVKVVNCGNKPSVQSVLNLTADGTTVATDTIPALAPLATATAQFAFSPAASFGTSVDIQAAVEAQGDPHTDNNTTAVLTLPLAHNAYEAPVLSATANGGNIVLTWTAPSQDREQIADDMEDYKPFSIADFGPWSVYDGDGAQTYALEGVEYPHDTDPKSFMVMNPYTLLGSLHNNENLTPHSGHQYLVSFDAGSSAEATDDWLISPAIVGGTSISLYAKGITDDYGSETMELYYSSATNAVGDFHKFGDTHTVKSDKWYGIEAELPADAKYFAVHSTSRHCFGLMVDDISYSVPLQVVGYNIYNNGTLTATVPATTQSFTVEGASVAGYQVSAVYDRGESDLSNHVSDATGISRPASTAATIEAIYTVDGKQTDHFSPGVNIVRMSDGTVRKVIRR